MLSRSAAINCLAKVCQKILQECAKMFSKFIIKAYKGVPKCLKKYAKYVKQKCGQKLLKKFAKMFEKVRKNCLAKVCQKCSPKCAKNVMQKCTKNDKNCAKMLKIVGQKLFGKSVPKCLQE